MAVTGQSTSILWGEYRLSTDHVGGTFETTNDLLEVRATLENDWNTHLIGARNRAGTSESIVQGATLAAYRSAHGARTEKPISIYRRGAGLGWCDINDAAIASLPESLEANTVEEREIAFGFTEIYTPYQGVVYDYSFEDGSTGVTGIKDGPWYEIGALAAGETYRFHFANPHSPAPNITTMTGLIRSASDALGTGATTQSTLTAVTSTASYQIVDVTGAITDAFWQLSISAFTGTVAYPVLLAIKI